ncbi:receptor-like protein 9DC3 [Prosopis cineraria]|uniref:receptor-like protein 9DC3 n=1 Tax=Prosopis cineraria TaxID=364024 RepID=UPI0024101391|nr:receptor-like protein 9DC3 [Prosopis cineraria]
MRRLLTSLCFVLCLQLSLLHSLSYSSFALPSCRTDQSLALLHFKNSFSIRKPDPSSLAFELCDFYETISHPKTSAWKNGTNCCSWDGVTCNPLGQRLDLNGNDFQGSYISANVSQLEIHLGDNKNLTGYLSRSNCSNSIRHLILIDANFTGELPYCIGHMKSLYSLDLSSNQFKGELPSSFLNLTHLTYMQLSDNNFSGHLPNEMARLPLLRDLVLSHSQLNGTIPSRHFTLPSLEFLDISSNQLTVQIAEISSYPLVSFDVSYNNLLSPITRSKFFLENITLLRYLDLSHNQLNGTIPSWCFLLPSLENLYISSNQFTGQIGEISSYSLKYLDVSDNKLSSSIPRTLFSLKNLTYLNLSHNFLTGGIQWHNFSWKNMKFLDLRNNSLQGELTSSICYATSLEFLSLSHNYFTSTIPHCISNSLEVLNLSHNKFTGTIPHYTGSFSLALSMLDLQMNRFSGSIPQSFEKGNNLKTLNLNGNLLEGSFPRSLVNCTKLKVLDLGRNNIEDTFPHWFQVLHELQVLVFRENKLYGSIPSFNDETNHAFLKLRVLDLLNNNFSGLLPTAFFKSFEAMRNADEREPGLHYMGYESMYQDSIEVTMKGLDVHLERILTVFTTIDVSMNMFEGKIPKVIEELCKLKVLNFSHNRLIGAIPSSMGKFEELGILGLVIKQACRKNSFKIGKS